MKSLVLFFLSITSMYAVCMEQSAIRDLSCAIQWGNVERVGRILNSGQVGINDRIGNYTPLGLAVVHGRTSVIRLLLSHPKIEVNASYSNGPFALSRVTDTGVAKLLLRNGADPSVKDQKKISAFVYALFLNQAPERVIELMLQKMVEKNSNVIDTINGKSLLKKMIQVGQTRYIPLLLQYGVPVPVTMVKGNCCSPFHQLLQTYYLTKRCTTCLRYFPRSIEENKNAFECDDCVCTKALARDDVDQIKILINGFPWRVNGYNARGKTLLYEAVKKGAKNIFKYLLSVGADMQRKTDNKRSVWHALCTVDMMSLIFSEQRTMNDALSIMNDVDCYGYSPLAHAMRGNNTDVFARLLTLNADYKRNGVSGDPLYWAVVDKKKPFILLLMVAEKIINARVMHYAQKTFDENDDVLKKMYEAYEKQECVVCFDKYGNSIPCSNKHTTNVLCSNCFQELKKDGVFKCPLCRSEEKISP